MRSFLALSLFLASWALSLEASAAQTHYFQGHLSNGMPNPVLAPMGILINDDDDGMIMYVSAVDEGVTPPKNLRQDCLYNFEYQVDRSKSWFAIRLTTEPKIVSCGHNFPQVR